LAIFFFLCFFFFLNFFLSVSTVDKYFSLSLSYPPRLSYCLIEGQTLEASALSIIYAILKSANREANKGINAEVVAIGMNIVNFVGGAFDGGPRLRGAILAPVLALLLRRALCKIGRAEALQDLVRVVPESA